MQWHSVLWMLMKARVYGNKPAGIFGIDGTKEGLEAVKDGTLAATVYNDKEGQAAAMANLAFSIVTEDENNPNPFKIINIYIAHIRRLQKKMCRHFWRKKNKGCDQKKEKQT